MSQTTTLWVHPFNGIAGDMMLGALIDAGADVAHLTTELQKLDVDGWTLLADPISRHGISATNVQVKTDEGHSHRTAGDIIALVNAADYPTRVIERATAVFTVLAEAEGRVHNKPPELVHFHEVGGIDAIVDVIGSCLALEQLGVERIVCATISVGHGITKSAHGRIPHPAPATVHLLEGMPVKGLDLTVELTTPTGAALMRALADETGPMPTMAITGSGFGAGDAELDGHPNLLHVVLGTGEAHKLTTDELVVLETNVDDLSGEYLAHAVQRLMVAGALDAWATPIDMKRGRPAVTIAALVEPNDVDAIGAVLLAETGSLGYRASGVARRSVSRRIGEVAIDGHTIAIKESEHTAKAEYVDVTAAAEALDRPARLIAAEAEAAWALEASRKVDDDD